jgi:hypothetical protein
MSTARRLAKEEGIFERRQRRRSLALLRSETSTRRWLRLNRKVWLIPRSP